MGQSFFTSTCASTDSSEIVLSCHAVREHWNERKKVGHHRCWKVEMYDEQSLQVRQFPRTVQAVRHMPVRVTSRTAHCDDHTNVRSIPRLRICTNSGQNVTQFLPVAIDSSSRTQLDDHPHPLTVHRQMPFQPSCSVEHVNSDCAVNVLVTSALSSCERSSCDRVSTRLSCPLPHRVSRLG